MSRKLVAVLACRNQGSRLFGKPIQNLDIDKGIRVIDNIIDCLKTIKSINSIVLAISEGKENDIFKKIAKEKRIKYITGDEIDVLSRLILACKEVEGTDVFRVTSESPFLYYKAVEKSWVTHCNDDNDATFFDEIIDGCGFEFIKLNALELSHKKGNSRHRSKCNIYKGKLSLIQSKKNYGPKAINRKDLRLTVDNPEDLVVVERSTRNFVTKP